MVTYKRSLVSRYFLQPFWNWFVKLWPTTVAPNTVRDAQLNCSMLNTFLGMCVDHAIWPVLCTHQLRNTLVL